jgi:hypothetical protein
MNGRRQMAKKEHISRPCQAIREEDNQGISGKKAFYKPRLIQG